jgi:peptidoglycan/xylan/chitin deacetylase (PgdA/CDA1 family)
MADSQWRRNRVLMLCYHGISLADEHEWDPSLFITKSLLRERLQLLRDEHYSVLSLDEAVRRLQSNELPARSVVLTFDDGFYNFHSAAMPILREFNVPATVYVSTYHCLNQRPILRPVLSYVLWRANKQGLQVASIPGLPNEINLFDRIKRESGVDQWAAALRSQIPDREERMDAIGKVARTLEVDWQEVLRSRILHLMTTDEVAAVALAGADVQLHTHRHRTPRDEATFRFEITENRRVIEQLTQRSATHFCYPSGDYDPVYFPWLRDMGVQSATTCETGLATNSDNPLLLPRYIDTMGQSELMFRSWLAGTGQLLSLSRRGSH